MKLMQSQKSVLKKLLFYSSYLSIIGRQCSVCPSPSDQASPSLPHVRPSSYYGNCTMWTRKPGKTSYSW